MEYKDITDLDIQALVDGETDTEKSRFLLKVISQNPLLHSRYLLYQKQKDLLKKWWKDN